MKASQQTPKNKRKSFDKFQLSLTNPLTIRSKQDYLQYSSEVLTPSQIINLLETDEDLFNLLNESSLKFDKSQLHVSFKIANKTKTLLIKFKRRSADEQISCLTSLLQRTTLERDQFLNKSQAQQITICQHAKQIFKLKKTLVERDQLLNKNQALQKVISQQTKEIVKLKQGNKNQGQQKVIRQQAKEIQKLKQAHKLKCQQLETWHLTHCAKCGKKIQVNHGNAYGRPSCSQKCMNFVKHTLKWNKIFDFQLN